MSSSPRELVVWLDAADFGSRRPVAIARLRPGSRPIVSWEYVRSWLDDPRAFAVDPGLPLIDGEVFIPDGRLPGILDDTAPDRWGKGLLQRREAADARLEQRRARTLNDWDFLVGVTDETRMGALRISASEGGPFLDDRDPFVPPQTTLRTLEFAAREVEAGRDIHEVDQAIAILLAPGSSLGGARPKANFREPDGTLWIAKFPSDTDRHDVGAWEYALNHLALHAGIRIPDARTLRLSSRGTTFAVQRFDRTPNGRTLFASAMTMTGKHDGDDASYLDLAQSVADFVAPNAIESDLSQLFRRLAFNVLVGNRDDHLRNHGFLRAPEGWRLSPAFDLNAVPEAAEHSLALDDVSHAPDISTVLQTAPFYRLSEDEAQAHVADVHSAIESWRVVLGGVDIPPAAKADLSDHLGRTLATASA